MVINSLKSYIIKKITDHKIPLILASAIILITILTLGILLKKNIYEITIDEQLFETAEKQGVFKDKKRLPEYPEGKAFEILKYKNNYIEIISSEISKSDKPVYKKAKSAGIITIIENQTTDEKHSFEVKRETLFPCIPFVENCQKYINIEEIDKNNLFELNSIPKNYIALPVKIDEKILYADDENYPLYKSQFADFNYEILKSKKSRKKLYNYLSEHLMKDFFLPKMKLEYIVPEINFIAAAGDIMLGRGVQDAMFKSNNAEVVFTDTMPILKHNEFTIGNLECVVTSRNIKTEKTYNFKVSKNSLKYLQQAGFDYLMMTNNHCYDYGEEGFKDTLKAVKELHFATSGVGFNKTEALDFYRTNINGQNFSILSVGAYPVESKGFNGEKQATATETRAGILWRSPEVLAMVKEESKKDTVIIINVHAGSEYVKTPNNVQKTFYKELCEAGADVIFGSHPHVLQPVEMYNNSLIVWSLGNFVFPGMDEMPGATDTMIIRTGFIDKKLVYYEKYDARIVGRKVELK